MTFTSAVLGEVQHPTNILAEYLSRFRGVKKFKAYLLSWFDGWIYRKLQEGKPPWVYVVSQELAEALGCCRDTVFRHLKDLCEMGILKKVPYKRWATDNIWAYTIDFKRLRQELDPLEDFADNENQTAESLISDSRESDFRTPTVGNQTAYRSLTLNSSQVQPQHNLPAAVEKVKHDGLTHREESATGKKEKQEQECTTKPTKDELDTACTQVSRLSPDVQTNVQVQTAIEKYWANFPAALEDSKLQYKKIGAVT